MKVVNAHKDRPTDTELILAEISLSHHPLPDEGHGSPHAEGTDLFVAEHLQVALKHLVTLLCAAPSPCPSAMQPPSVMEAVGSSAGGSGAPCPLPPCPDSASPRNP